jgi:hypothetical protein
MTTRSLLALLVLTAGIPSLGRAQPYHTERGAALGGIGGALAGAAIGKNNGDTGAGALLGGAVGLITGAVVGNAMDDKARAQAYEQQQIYRMSRAVSTTDVINMCRSGLSDDVIANHIRENGVQRKLEVNDVIMLHRNGVSEGVITAMQHATLGAPPVAVAPVPRYEPRPVIVQEYYYSPRPYWYGHGPYHHHYYHHHHHPRHHPSPHVHWGISIGH